ncbi:HlyC/CorC family transporter [Aerococcaceae bacterium DSM 111176]|nr:HlyC/CorC family transporter [Aerococcaceae bacterium DSM 111176]
MDSPGSLWTQLLIIIALTIVNAIFAASEMAFVSVNHTKLKRFAEEGDKRATRVLTLLEDSDDFLATIQVAITLAGFLSSASAATSFADEMVKILPNFSGAYTVSIVVVTMILSYITLVFGELFPKQVALQMPEKFAMAVSGLIMGTQKVFKPFVWLLSTSTNILQKVTPIEFSANEEQFTREEMKAIIHESREEGSIDLAELTMLQGVLSLDTKTADEIMTPRTDTDMVDITDDYHEILMELLDTPYSRIPLYEDDKDNVVGVLHMKHLLKAAKENGFENLDFLEISTEPLFIPATIFIDDLLIQFRREQTHLAIIKDEYGGMAGIVTLEDVLEEIVGEIEDETDIHTSADIRKIDDYNFYLNGMLSIEKFNQYFDLKMEADDVDTIAGLMIYYMGFVPEDDEQVTLRINNYVLKTSLVENGRIRGIHLINDFDWDIEADFDASTIDEEYEEREETIDEIHGSNDDEDEDD